MSKARPIHNPPRDLRLRASSAEPTKSFEDESFLLKELEQEDEFYRKARLQYGGSGISGGGAGGASGNSCSTTVPSQSQQHRSSFTMTPPFLSINRSGDHESKVTEGQLVPAGYRNLGMAESLGAAIERDLSSSLQYQEHSSAESSLLLRRSSRRDSFDKKDREQTKARRSERKHKFEAQNSDLELGHYLPEDDNLITGAEHLPAKIRAVSEGLSSLGDDLPTFVPPPSRPVVLGKSSSLIFPTGVEESFDERKKEETRRKVQLAIDQCQSVRFPFKKKLSLAKMHLSCSEVPVQDIENTLGTTLHKLSLAGNRLMAIPVGLVWRGLPALRHLDLSQCSLKTLPPKWDLPSLHRLDLSYNQLFEFPDEGILEGLPEMHTLNLYGNQIAEIIVPANHRLLSRLEELNLGYNNLTCLPEDLSLLGSLRSLRVMNNLIEVIPVQVCLMDSLKAVDVSSNPVIQPPIETCERGLCSMQRYYHCLRLEENSKQRDHQKRSSKRKTSKKKNMMSQFISPLGAKIRSRTTNSRTSAGDSSHGSRNSFDDNASANGGVAEGELLSSSYTPSPRSAIKAPLRSSTGKRRSSSDGQSSVPEDEPVPLSLEIPVPAIVHTDGGDGDEAKEDLAPAGGHDAFKQESAKHLEDQGIDFVAMEEDEAGSPILQPLPLEEAKMPESVEEPEDVTVNDTLKVIFVGMACAGKTSMIKRLIEGRDAQLPKQEERTIGVDIYEWDPIESIARESYDIDTRIQTKDGSGDVDVKFSVWDFAGQHVYHATHQLFFSPRALYVLVWDMGATNLNTQKQRSSFYDVQGPFKLTYDSSDDEDEEFNIPNSDEAKRADRALERDIDEKVQFWVDCIQSSAPGAAIMPVATFDDYFDSSDGHDEAKRRTEIMRERLLYHQERRTSGLKERLNELYKEKRANTDAAKRIRNLLCEFSRPKLIFGHGEEDAVVRVSCTKYNGFDRLTEKVVQIATGRETGGGMYPIFHGHLGARIPKMRLQVRDVVRQMRDRFKVVEWGHFLSKLNEDGGAYIAEDVSDALHFLTNVGELSYFGDVMLDPTVDKKDKVASSEVEKGDTEQGKSGDMGDSDGEDDDEDGPILSIDDSDAQLDQTLGANDAETNSGLSQFVFLNPRWLVAAVACILRHDLSREICETKRLLSRDPSYEHQQSFGRSETGGFPLLNCPVITAEDAEMLWQAKKFTKKAAERALEYSSIESMTPFEFLQRLLIKFGVFVPIDLSIDKACLGGQEYAQRSVGQPQDGIEVCSIAQASPHFFFLPSLLGPGEPAEVWTYKNNESWKTTICHSVLFPDGVPPGFMERITSAVLSDLYATTIVSESVGGAHENGEHPPEETECCGDTSTLKKDKLRVKEIFCWRTAFYIKIGMEVPPENGERKESVVEIFAHLADRGSHLCVASASMGVGMRRFIISAKGQVGDGGVKIWKGGYKFVIRAIVRVVKEYGGLEYEKQGICPECLASKPVSEAAVWDLLHVRAVASAGNLTLRCTNGHRVDTRLVTGPHETLSKPRIESVAQPQNIVPVSNLLRGVVVVGLWDGKSGKVVRVGSGFVVDKRRGLIVTASHTLMNIWGDRSARFGENYYGLSQGKIVIGIIPRKKESDGGGDCTEAFFRYFADIVAKDEDIEASGVCHIDACVLRITTRMEEDVGGDGDGCGQQPERLLLNDPDALKKEKLLSLKVTESCELDEQIRILGYNQGGEGLLGPGERLNRFVDFARGYVCKKFVSEEDGEHHQMHTFKPRQEIVVICPTIGGHSGGPCVNQQGEVLGILSRADPAERQRCYLVPASAFKGLVKKAKSLY